MELKDLHRGLAVHQGLRGDADFVLIIAHPRVRHLPHERFRATEALPHPSAEYAIVSVHAIVKPIL